MTVAAVRVRILVVSLAVLLVSVASCSGSSRVPDGAPTLDGLFTAAYSNDALVPIRWVDDRLVASETIPLQQSRIVGPCVAMDGDRIAWVQNNGLVRIVRPWEGSDPPREARLSYRFTPPQGSPAVAACVWLGGGHQVYVGVIGRIDHADLTATEPEPKVVWHAEEGFHKPVEYFVRVGDTLLGIDDMMWPRYVVRLDITDVARPVFRGITELPSDVNMHYQDGVAISDTQCLLIAGGVHMGGSYNSLFRCTVRENTVESESVFEETGVWDSGPEDVTPGSGTVGNRFTAWTAIARVGSHVVIAAGARGMLFAPASNPTTLRQYQTPQPCRDVIAHGDLVLALVDPKDEGDNEDGNEGGNEGATHAVIAYRFTDGAFELLHRLALPTSVRRLARQGN